MGLDLLELILDTEETFGIQIDDNHAAWIQTPGALAAYVAARIAATREVRCRSQAGFYRLRSALMTTCDVPRKRIRPSTPLAELLPQDARLSERWARLKTALDSCYRLPAPEYPPRLARWIMTIQCALPVLLLFHAAWQKWPVFPSLVAVLTLFVSTGSLMQWRFQHWRTRIPKKFRTVAELLPYVRIPSSLPWSDTDILKTILLLTSEHSGVPLHEIREDSRFVQDLGMG
jgi:hypothetical protein